MATFKPPTGFGSRNPNDHVTSPAQNFGYRYIVARLAEGGSTAAYIMRWCADAHEERAPKDAVCRNDGGGWKTRTELTRSYGSHLDTYTRALIKYEEELWAERKFDSHQRST